MKNSITSEMKNEEVKINSTKILFRNDTKVPSGRFQGKSTHFKIDANSLEHLAMAFRKWTMDNNTDELTNKLGLLKSNFKAVN